ncbi:hypothetical protein BaRGS_00010177 [Batillaria attramentaria]|uniref:Dehydrogenase/reductase SDR family member 11 n=1 Tax=Batillaria attramentaria TaxID=370345 RepID=A0ABD0LGP3_9CAEN
MAERWNGRVALVTGASAGIGASVAQALVERGMKVVACARNVAKLEVMREELRGYPGSLTVVTCDVSKEDQVLAMFDVIRRDPNLGRLDVCINNAGLAFQASLLSGDTDSWRRMFDVNVLGLMMCTREAVKLMREKNIDDGQIILVNSLLGVKPLKRIPLHGYMVTKHAVAAVREGLRTELKELKSHIRVSQVCPGVVETEFFERMFGDQDKAEAMISRFKCLKAEDVKDSILYILDAPPHVEVTDILMPPTEQADV